jgi:hypothetical protein
VLRSEALVIGAAQGAILLRHGLAAWLEAAQPFHPPPSSPLPINPSPTVVACCAPLAATVAAIILRLSQEAAHA